MISQKPIPFPLFLIYISESALSQKRNAIFLQKAHACSLFSRFFMPIRTKGGDHVKRKVQVVWIRASFRPTHFRPTTLSFLFKMSSNESRSSSGNAATNFTDEQINSLRQVSSLVKNSHQTHVARNCLKKVQVIHEKSSSFRRFSSSTRLVTAKSRTSTWKTSSGCSGTTPRTTRWPPSKPKNSQVIFFVFFLPGWCRRSLFISGGKNDDHQLSGISRHPQQEKAGIAHQSGKKLHRHLVRTLDVSRVNNALLPGCVESVCSA